MQGMTNPYFAGASGLALQSASPLTGGTVANYLNPYANYVMGNMQEVFGQQQRNTTGQLQQAAGGIGADRIALGQGELARQQGLSAGQTMSGIYQNALSAAQNEAQRQQGASYLLANMGPAAQNAALQANQALLGVGQQQQTLDQQQQNALYAQQQAQFAYPFQTNQYLAGITGALAPAMGGTTYGVSNQSATAAPPNPYSQILGGVATGVGALGQAGVFNNMGSGNLQSSVGDTYGAGAGGGYGSYGGVQVPTFGSYRRGGGIPLMASGGNPLGGDSKRVGSNPFRDSIVPDADLVPTPVNYPKIDLSPPKQQSTDSGKGSGIGQIIGTAAKILPMFLAARGGRIPMAAGGAVGPYSLYPQSFDEGGATGGFDYKDLLNPIISGKFEDNPFTTMGLLKMLSGGGGQGFMQMLGGGGGNIGSLLGKGGGSKEEEKPENKGLTENLGRSSSQGLASALGRAEGGVSPGYGSAADYEAYLRAIGQGTGASYEAEKPNLSPLQSVRPVAGQIPRRQEGGFADRYPDDIEFSSAQPLTQYDNVVERSDPWGPSFQDRFDPTYEGFGQRGKPFAAETGSERIPMARDLSDLAKPEFRAAAAKLLEAPIMDVTNLGLGTKPAWDTSQETAPAKVAAGATNRDIEGGEVAPRMGDKVAADLPRREPDRPLRYAQAPSRTATDAPSTVPGERTMPASDLPYPEARRRDIGDRMSRSPWAALTRFGAETLAGTSPFFGTNVGRGAVAGLKHQDEQRATLMKEEEMNQNAQKMWEAAQQHADPYRQMTKYQESQAEAGRYKSTMLPGGMLIEDQKHNTRKFIPYDQIPGMEGKVSDQPIVPPSGAQPGVPPQAGAPAVAPPPPLVAPPPTQQTAPPPTAPPQPPATAQTITPGVQPAAMPPPQPPPQRAAPAPVPAPAPQQRIPLGSDAPPIPQRMPMAPSDMVPGAAQANRQVSVDMQKKAAVAATAGINTATMLEQTERALAELPKNGFLAAGAGAQWRGEIAKNLNTISSMMGIDARIDPSQVSSVEELKKLTTRMGFELSRTLGAREAMQIVQQATAAVPGADNTPLGARKIISGVKAAIDQQVSWKTFLDQWVNKTGGNSNGAQEYFNRMRPPSYWNAKAWSELVDPADHNALINNRKNPAAVAAINHKYGPGVAEFMLQRQFGAQ
jgi:hypothetical protein